MSLIHDILDKAIEKNASDIHLTKDIYPVLRIDGKLKALKEFSVMDDGLLRALVEGVLSKEDALKYEEQMVIDTSLQYGGSRFRIHIFRQSGVDAFSIRLIPLEIPKLKTLNLPKVINKFTLMKDGLVLVTGATGSGKSTTLAAIIDAINHRASKHIITVEDPVEFVHKHKQSLVNQKEVGQDIATFAEAVKSAMREDPDILLVGEMRDLDTIKNAITMAETGHLVFATLHTKSVAETVDRMIDVFPPGQQQQIRIQLSNVLQGIVCQRLLPRKGGGRIPACEVLVVTQAIRNNLKDRDSPPSAINDQMFLDWKKTGSLSLERSLVDMVQADLISYDVALSHVNDREAFEKFQF